jgi:glycosidase
VDVPHFLVKHDELRDNPPAEESDPWWVHRYGQRLVWNFVRPELYEVLRRWRGVADEQEPGRLLSRWCGGDPRKIRLALLLLFGLRGTPTLYYGDELGLGDVPVPAQSARDVGGPHPQRTPMPWSPEPGAGSRLPASSPGCRSATAPDSRSGSSAATHARRSRSPDLVALRRQSRELRGGAYVSLPAPERV